MKPKHQRLCFIMVCVGIVSCATFVICNALKENILYFLHPSQLESHHFISGKKLRLGGTVKHGSVKVIDNQMIEFSIMDDQSNVSVQYNGALPYLFREGQTVVIDGQFANHLFVATNVLAKHDEVYKPPAQNTTNTPCPAP